MDQWILKDILQTMVAMLFMWWILLVYAFMLMAFLDDFVQVLPPEAPPKSLLCLLLPADGSMPVDIEISWRSFKQQIDQILKCNVLL